MNTYVFGEPKKYIIMDECEKEYIVCEKRIYRDGGNPHTRGGKKRAGTGQLGQESRRGQ